jgi:hypothetical protein
LKYLLEKGIKIFSDLPFFLLVHVLSRAVYPLNAAVPRWYNLLLATSGITVRIRWARKKPILNI